MNKYFLIQFWRQRADDSEWAILLVLAWDQAAAEYAAKDEFKRNWQQHGWNIHSVLELDTEKVNSGDVVHLRTI
jgi:hypothetical protein